MTANDHRQEAPPLSIVIPAKDEADNLTRLLPALRAQYPKAQAEIIVVDDGSHDDTAQVCAEHEVMSIRHPYSKGNGAAIKSGARAAGGETIIFMDADGQHSPDDIPHLLERLDEGFDMVVGARGAESQANAGRHVANTIYNRLASRLVSHPISDLTSGFRAVRAGKFKEFLYLLPNGFSYPTTITMAFFRMGYSVAYVPIRVQARQGNRRSHIRPLKDGARFLVIIFKIVTLYSPLKLFAPLSAAFFLLGVGYIGFTLLAMGRFTNMGVVLLGASVLVFLIGLISEQVTMLLYHNS